MSIKSTLRLPELLVNSLEAIEEATEAEDTKTRVLRPGRRPDRVHAQLWDTSINCSDTSHAAQHGTHGTTTAAIIPDLEDLQFRADLVRAALEDGGRDGIGGHVAVAIG